MRLELTEKEKGILRLLDEVADKYGELDMYYWDASSGSEFLALIGEAKLALLERLLRYPNEES